MAPFAILVGNQGKGDFNHFGIDFNLLFLPNVEPIIQISIFILALFIIKALISILSNYLIFKNIFQIRSLTQQSLLSAYHSLSYNDFLKRKPGSIITNILTLTADFANSVLRPLYSGIQDLLTLSAIIFVLLVTDAKLVFIAMTVTFLLLVVYLKIINPINIKLGQVSNSQTDSMTHSVQESIQSFREIKIYNILGQFHKSLAAAGDTYRNAQTKIAVIQIAPRYLIEILIVGTMTTIILLSKSNLESNEVLVAKIGVFGLAGLRLLPSISNLVSITSKIVSQKNTIVRIDDLLKNSRSDVQNVRSEKPLKWENLEFSDVEFSYSGQEKPILKQFSFSLKKNTFLGVVGSSGSGKSTFCDLISGFQYPSKGVIQIDGKDLIENLENWSNNIAFISQSPLILSETILYNVCLTKDIKNCDLGRLEEIIRSLQLSEFVDSLEHGLFTRLGVDGVKLSGGQAQRFDIARALYSDRDFLIFDEPTSALDRDNAEAVKRTIEQYHGKKTIIIVSHNEGLLINCDKVLDLTSRFKTANQKR